MNNKLRLTALASAATLVIQPAFADASGPEISALYMMRGGDTGFDILENGWDGANGAPLTTSADLGNASGFGIEVDYLASVGNTPLQIRGLMMFGMGSSHSVNDFDVAFGSGVDTGGLDLSGSGVFCFCEFTVDTTVDRDFGLTSLEANIGLAEFGNVQVMGGLRSMSLSDNLYAHIDVSPTFLGTGIHHNVLISNHAMGPQLTASGSWQSGNATISAFGAVGYYKNTVSADVERIGEGDLVGVNDTGNSADAFWTSGAEVGVNVSFQAGENAFLTVGYNAIYMSQVGNSVETFANTEFSTGTTTITYSDALYHGASLSWVKTF